ncbi:MAG: gamma-glutamylcyclotransferase family protein [Gammaproteobacteria bacterium]
MTYKIFAYGSLIHQGSLKKTVPEARNIFPAKTRGLKRVFNLASTYRFDSVHKAPVCVLNVVAAEADAVMNGICFEMDETSMHNLLQRESGYHFRKIRACRYHDEEVRFDAYYFQGKEASPYQYLSKSTAQKHYLDLCLRGSEVFGKKFVEDFKSSTFFWNIDCELQQQAIWQGDY